MSRSFAAIVVLVCAGAPAAEAASLRGQASHGSGLMDDLLSLAMASHGGAAIRPGTLGEAEERVRAMTEALLPVFHALPQTADGFLDASAVRYLLHRYFIDRHGWFVQGGDAAGEVANGSLPEAVLAGEGGVLGTILSLRLEMSGLSLHDVAILATALEALARSETRRRLHAAYRMLGLAQREGHLSEEEMWSVYKVYLQIYALGQDTGRDTDNLIYEEVQEAFQSIHEAFPNWDEFLRWVREVREEVLFEAPESRATFDGQVLVLEEMQHRYGSWQDQECLSIKEAMREHITPGTGRIPLATFYAAELPMGWKPEESEEYLSYMGALDDTDPANPSVVVPNYFDSPSNCAGPSKFYMSCCISECESLLGYVERTLASPMALPRQIVDIIERLPSSTVETPRTLPPQLVQRLESIAETHGGHAPLHGRLFHQWMHHAYPAECSFPSLARKNPLNKPMAAPEFEAVTGMNATIDPVRLELLLFQATRLAGAKEPLQPREFLEELPWSHEEELFVTCRSDNDDGPASGHGARRTARPTSKSTIASIWRGAILLAIAVSMLVMLVHTALSARTPMLSSAHDKTSAMV